MGPGSHGPGLLKALRARSSIIFSDEGSPAENIAPQSDHLVVCEEAEDLAQVIAANYAYSLRAGLCLIPAIDRSVSDEILENFYSLYEDREVSPTQALERLTDQLRNLMGPVTVPAGSSITFITGGLPFGFAVPEAPSTHLFKYPELGISVVNAIAAELPQKPGIGFVALIDPATTEAQEIDAAEKLLPARGAFIRTYYGAGAGRNEADRTLSL